MVIGGLKPDTTYSITVAAYTTKGDGARSKPKLVVTKGAGQSNVWRWMFVDGCDGPECGCIFQAAFIICVRDGVNYIEISVFQDRLGGLQHPGWVVCLSFSNEIPEANVCTVQSLLFF